MIDLTRYDPHEILYPHKLSAEYGLSLSDVYKELECHADSDDGILVSLLELKCPVCESYTGRQYYSVWDLPWTFECPICHTHINNYQAVEDSAVVIYRKI